MLVHLEPPSANPNRSVSERLAELERYLYKQSQDLQNAFDTVEEQLDMISEAVSNNN